MTPADKLKQEALAQLGEIDDLFRILRSKGGDLAYSDDNRAQTHEVTDFNSACLGAIERIVGEEHTYSKQAQTVIEQHGIASSSAAGQLYGIVRALSREVRNGYLVRFSELLHADLFGDFVEMGDHLVASGYKDAAAVIIGGALEGHLRLLCAKHAVPASDTDQATGKSVPRKADRLNAELVKANAYSGLDQKNVTGWLGLRNKAAHCEYSAYTKEQVELMSQGIKLFIQQNPA